MVLQEAWCDENGQFGHHKIKKISPVTRGVFFLAWIAAIIIGTGTAVVIGFKVMEGDLDGRGGGTTTVLVSKRHGVERRVVIQFNYDR